MTPKLTAEQLLQDELLPNEQILWQGQPDPSVWFTSSDYFLVPLTIFWSFGAIGIPGFALSKNFLFLDHPEGWPISGFMLIPMLLFPLIGIYLTIGRFFLKANRKKHTYYAVTNKRVIAIVTKSSGKKNITQNFINTIPAINKVSGFKKTHSIFIGILPAFSGVYLNTGLDSFAMAGIQGSVIFFDLQDAEPVYQLINRLRAEAHS
ncbi:MAG: hypothetical protein VKJ06_07655 [Vampirovibrionales bacterium]|nr:hypothetical protein [Vampirovibrionales bacterium]